MAIRNLEYLRSLSTAELPDLGAKLYEALSDLLSQQQTLAQQMNGNGQGQPSAPPAVQGLKVQAANGHFQIAIQDDAPVYRGVRYYVEHADNPQFTNPHVLRLGDARNHNIFLGNVKRYFRAYSSYGSSAPGSAVYHGGAQPVAVEGGGENAGPAFLPSEGSGTGARGQGLQGPGQVPFRSVNGAPPVRS